MCKRVGVELLKTPQRQSLEWQELATGKWLGGKGGAFPSTGLSQGVPLGTSDCCTCWVGRVQGEGL